MLDMGWAELLVIAIVALFAVGPEKLPEVAQGLARFIRQMQRLVSEVREAIHMEDFDARIRESSRSYSPPATYPAETPESTAPLVESEAIELAPAAGSYHPPADELEVTMEPRAVADAAMAELQSAPGEAGMTNTGAAALASHGSAPSVQG
ncbi:twin-arginine translocase TatA/TatE family subunit [Candidatus Magnetaquicoccus inordinatus]|uniref:twin-arginine translocase TatA/TatE family subunit n=1 Tax=Candidatus Magnetaquicoccus inordinatus TaxID=2496818 RepID=UPI00102AA7FC|nr:twin-arginine translocase TatA/TatE family subunit [Candidatus Magnetaquicoccus inordinatus]